ncbi:Uncharacterised protein [uncultured archaeon]|nr:Uncharacterised protein [uncultured archaeon]
MLRTIIAMLCLACMTLAFATAADETLDIGPITISLDLGSVGSYVIEKEETAIIDHRKPRFQYEISPASIKVDGIQDTVQLEVHQMSSSEPLEDAISERDQVSGLVHCIMRSNMVPVGEDLETKPYDIDGKEGVLATIKSDSENPMYIAAYSPDQKDGSGSIVCIVGSDFPWETTKGIFATIRATVT